MVVVAVLPLSGCLTEAYVAADKATYEAIAPEYGRYIEHDVGLTDEQKARRKATLLSWQARLEEAGAYADVD